MLSSSRMLLAAWFRRFANISLSWAANAKSVQTKRLSVVSTATAGWAMSVRKVYLHTTR